MSVNTKMTALADEIRELSGTTEKLGLDAMTDNVGGANAEIVSQEALITSIMSALEGKALSGAINITVDANGLITAKGGDRVATHQLAFQPATTITPSSTSQVAVSSGHYTGGDIVVVGDSNLTAENIKAGTSIFGVNGIAENADEVMDKVYNRGFTAVEHNTLSKIGSYAFAGCSKLVSTSFPAVTSIGGSAFTSCSSLTSVYFPLVSSIGQHAFSQCRDLTLIDFPLVTSIPGYTFGNCTNLTSINLPRVNILSYGAFYYCTKLSYIDLPELNLLGSYAFSNCSNLQNISFPKLQSIEPSAFASCLALSEANFPLLKIIGSSAFQKCYNLSSLTLGASSVCTLSSSNAFSSTPYAGYSSYFSGTPHIYVPGSLVEAYKTATNWTFFSRYIDSKEYWWTLDKITEEIQIGMTENVILNSVYLNSENDLTPTVEVIPEDETIINITNLIVTKENISFNITSLNRGMTNINIYVTLNDQVATRTFPIRVYDPSLEPTFSVDSVNGATYTFIKNSNGYYENNNKGIDNSFAICKVSISAPVECTMYVDCINYAESNYDYGILSKLNNELSLSKNEDSSTVVQKSFKGLQSSSIVTQPYTLTAGEHYIYIKYIKDGSSSINYDSLQFKIRFS